MQSREKTIYRVTIIGSIVNIVLIGLKFAAGIIGRSSALIADAVHSLTDFITDVVILIFIKLSGKPRDDDHEYGHGKYETFATLIIGVFLAAAGVGLFLEGMHKVISALRGEILPEPTWLALIVAAASIIVKEILFRYTKREGDKVNSEALVANAWHHRSDAISSLGTMVGIGGAMFFGVKWRILDPVAAVLVSILIVKAGIDIIRPAINELLEASLPAGQTAEITRIITETPGVKGFHNLRTRKIGNVIAVDVHVKMCGDITLNEAHEIATTIERSIRARFGPDSIITIHMEPFHP